MKPSFSALDLPDTGAVVVGVLEDRDLTPSAKALDGRLSGALGRAMAASRFKGKKDQTLSLLAPGGGLERVLLLGLGKAAELTAVKAQGLGAAIWAALAGNGGEAAFVAVDSLPGAPLASAEMAAEMALGAALRSYRFDKYRTTEKDEDKPALKALRFGCEDDGRARALFEPAQDMIAAVRATRDWVSEPANVIHPESLAEQARKLEKFGLEVEVLGEKELKKLGMNALLGVGQGSARESQVVVMQWWGLGKPEKEKKGKKAEKGGHEGQASETPSATGPLAFLGKGVTFDTGGISIKPAAGMEDMKWDMAGAAAVIGAMQALAGRKARVNAIGVVGLVENMPSSTAQRPGDVVTSMSGQTIEVINTDAEGRLVLCDILHYTNERFKPCAMIDLATLTGAIIIALGHEKAGLFSNDDELARRLIEAGEAVSEPLWRLPLGEAYDKQIKSDIADMKNVGNRGAGSITAAQFLQRFVGQTPWAHLDIAGVAWAKKDEHVTPKGASGFGVRLLDRLVRDFYEQR